MPLALLHLFTLLGPRPPPARRRVLRPPSSVLPPPSSPPAALSVRALLTRPHQPGENRTGPPRSGRSPITVTVSKPARRTRPTLRPFSWRVQAVVYVQNFKNITQVTPLLRWLPAAPGGWGGVPCPPVAADLARLLPPLFIRPESTPRPPCSSPRPVSSSQVCRLLSASVLPGPSLHNAFCDFVTSRPSLCHSELRSEAPPCLGLPPPFPPHGPDLASPQYSVL